jgi:hypothetical protein
MEILAYPLYRHERRKLEAMLASGIARYHADRETRKIKLKADSHDFK